MIERSENMIDLNNYPFVNVTLAFYFRIRNAKMWGGKGSVGYSAFSMEECKNLNLLTESNIEDVRKSMANDLGVTVADVDFITKSEYELATADNDDEDFDELGM